MKEKLGFSVNGHVKIVNKDTNEVLVDKNNAIHNRNMAIAIARGLSNEDNGFVFGLVLGNGGTNILPDFSVQYLPPNVTSADATLYHETYSEIVDGSNGGAGVGNSVASSQAPSPSISSIVTVIVEIAADEPAGQPTDDSTPGGDFDFDELGLITADSDPLLLSHIVFNPLNKSAMRSILITYTLTISVDNELVEV